jgi:hypothetical protein
MRLRTLIMLDFVSTGIAAFIFAIYRGYSFALITLFLGGCLGSIMSTLSRPKHGYERIREAELKRFELFKERLAREGVVDETEDIARAKRFLWFTNKEKIHQFMLSRVKDFGEIISDAGRTYVIYRETLDSLLGKLPMKDGDLSKLTEAERRVFNLLQATSSVVCDEKGEWQKIHNSAALPYNEVTHLN